MSNAKAALPRIVTRDQWRAERERLLVREKAHTRARDALNAERRRLPMWRIEKDYVLDGPDGRSSLADLFAGRRQLMLYHFMFGPNATAGCDGCSMVVDNMCHPAHLHARDISLVLVSRAPLHRIEPFRRRMGWTSPWYSSDMGTAAHGVDSRARTGWQPCPGSRPRPPTLHSAMRN